MIPIWRHIINIPNKYYESNIAADSLSYLLIRNREIVGEDFSL